MATPLPSTPGDRREDQAQAAGDAVGLVYAQIELVLIATVATLARKVATGAMNAIVAGRHLDRTNRTVFAVAAPRAETAVREAIQHAAAAASSPRAVVPEVLASALEAAADTAASTAQDALASAVQAAQTAENAGPAASLLSVQRRAVEQAVASTRGGMPGSSLSLSRIQAAQKALDDLGAQGVTGFVDRAGRRWDLASYVEMATRTAVSNALDDLQNSAWVRAGLDLAVVATHSTEGSCPHCLPWLGRTLSLTGATPGHSTLAEAKAAGFRHPNCRCFWTPVGAGIAPEVTNPVSLDRAAAVYKASQRQRALERRVREAHRRAASAITPRARADGRRDLAAARAASATHRQRTGLVMTKVGARRREHGSRAH